MKQERRDLSEEELQKRRAALLARKREARRRKRRNAIIFKSVILAILSALLAVVIWFISGGAKKINSNVTGRTSVIAENTAAQDAEGLQTMRVLARNMVFLIKSIALGKEKYGLPETEPWTATNFIR